MKNNVDIDKRGNNKEKVNSNECLMQGMAQGIEEDIKKRMHTRNCEINKINSSYIKKVDANNARKVGAFIELDKGEQEIRKLQKTNCGGNKGIHGFNAEYMESSFTNARRVLKGKRPNTIVLGNNGPIDLIRDGKPMQSKFNKDPMIGLEHGKNYLDQQMIYPKNNVFIYEEALKGENKDLLDVRNKIDEVSKIRGQRPEEWICSSELNYNEVQKENAIPTINKERERIAAETRKVNRIAKEEKKLQEKKIINETKPSLKKATVTAGQAALFGAAIEAVGYCYEQKRDGRKITDANMNDVKECGKRTLKGASKSAVSAYLMYAATNYTRVTAPAVSAIISGVAGMKNPIKQLAYKEINGTEFVGECTKNAFNVASVAGGAAIGQVAIPIPVFGALVGSICMGKVSKEAVTKIEKKVIGKKEINNNIIEKTNSKYIKIKKTAKNNEGIKFKKGDEIRIVKITKEGYIVERIGDNKILYRITDEFYEKIAL